MSLIEYYWGDGSCPTQPPANSIAMDWRMGESGNLNPGNVGAWMDTNWVDGDTCLHPRNRLSTNWMYAGDPNGNGDVTVESWADFILNGFYRMEQDRTDYEALIQAIYDAGKPLTAIIGDIEQGWISKRFNFVDNASGPGPGTDTVHMVDVIQHLYDNYAQYMPIMDVDALVRHGTDETAFYNDQNSLACMQQWNAFVHNLFVRKFNTVFGDKVRELFPTAPVMTYDTPNYMYSPLRRGTSRGVAPMQITVAGWGNPVFYLNDTHAQDLEHLFILANSMKGPMIPWVAGQWRVNTGTPTACNSVDFGGPGEAYIFPLLDQTAYDAIYAYCDADERIPAVMYW